MTFGDPEDDFEEDDPAPDDEDEDKIDDGEGEEVFPMNDPEQD